MMLTQPHVWMSTHTGGHLLYSDLATTLLAVEQEPARIAKEALFAELLERALRTSPDELSLALSLTSLQLSPNTRPLKLGMGNALILAALADACGDPVSELSEELSRVGDLGILAEARLAAGPRDDGAAAAFTLAQMHAALFELSTQSGKGASGRKTEQLSELLRRSSPVEARYMVRSLLGKLRTGLGGRSLRAALGQAGAATVPDPSDELLASQQAVATAKAAAEEAEVAARAAEATGEKKAADKAAVGLRKAVRAVAAAQKKLLAMQGKRRRDAVARVNAVFHVQPCYHQLVGSIARQTVWSLSGGAVAGRPLTPMTAAPAASVEEVMARLGAEEAGVPFLAEMKYDGERCQLHLLPPPPEAASMPPAALASPAADAPEAGEAGGGEGGDDDGGGGRVVLYSRSLDDMSVRFPDVTGLLPAALQGASSCVLDAEVCAYDPAAMAVLPFQTLAGRSRKAPTAEQLASTPVCLYVFDLLELDGRSLLQTPLGERRKLLAQHVQEVPGRLALAEGVEVADATGLEAALMQSVAQQAEGLMCKALVGADGGYDPGKRSLRWLKLKRDYIDALGDSLDVAPIGGYYGTGKRAGVYGAYLLGCWDEGRQKWQPMGKLGTGFTDEDLAEWHAYFTSDAGRAVDASSSEALPGWLDAAADGLPVGFSKPNVWLEPTTLWEVRAAALSLSPTWGAARGTVDGGGERGLALRFPRFLRARPDKALRDATSSEQLAAMFATQPEASAASSTAATASAAEAAASAAAERAAQEHGGDVVSGVAPSATGGKFWRAEVVGSTLTISWGKVGSKGQSKTTEHASEEEARAQREKQRAKKEKSKYVF